MSQPLQLDVSPASEPSADRGGDDSAGQDGEVVDRPTAVGNYQVLDAIARGGMGAVHRGRHVLLGTAAAVKLLRSDLLGDTRSLQRFLNEAVALSRVHHPHVVRILDCGISDTGVSYLVMDLLEGESLYQRLRREPLPLDAVLRYAEHIADALSAVHDAGLIHRDLKPSNIQIVPGANGREDRAVLLDFGVAKFLDAETVANVSCRGIIWGTPQYMSPEQASGETSLDPRSDVFSLGSLVFEMLSGQTPHNGHKVEVIHKIRTMPAPPIRELRPELPEPVAELLARMLDRDLEERPSSMDEVVLELRALRLRLATRVIAKGTITPPEASRPVSLPLPIPLGDSTSLTTLSVARGGSAAILMVLILAMLSILLAGILATS